jgi:hypothetical protein
MKDSDLIVLSWRKDGDVAQLLAGDSHKTLHVYFNT